MKIAATSFRERKAWVLDNGEVAVTMLQGGGHIAALNLHERPGVNPLWEPVWPSLEPWQYRPALAARYGSQLLAAICGHNLCLGWFGEPSAEEAAAGLGGHGEAPVVRWRLLSKESGADRMELTCGCDLPVADIRFTRRLLTRPGSHIVRVRETVRNLARRDVPFTMCEHVTFGAPFVEKGVTCFDMPATRGHTFPGEFGPKQRLKNDAPFTWPSGPGASGRRVDLRFIGREFRASSDFTAQLMDLKMKQAWFTALNPRLGLLVAYVWTRADFPWVGNWEENYARRQAPWAGKSLTRGMEFSNTPFPEGLRAAVNRSRFHGEPCFRWLPARGRVTMDYAILTLPVERDVRGVTAIERTGRTYRLTLDTGDRPVVARVQ